MYYSSILMLVVISNLLISGAYSERYLGEDWNRKHEMPLYGSDDEVINIGNGVNRKNIVILDQGSGHSGARPDLHNRFRSDEDNGDGNSWRGSSTTNIGNGEGNHNTVVVNGGGGAGGGRRRDHTSRNSNGWSNGGTTYVRNRNNGLDVFNVGYGKDNQNSVTVDGKPIEPDCYGSTCDDLKATHRTNGAARINPLFSLCLFFFSFVPFFLLK